jgi:hypothetical protein
MMFVPICEVVRLHLRTERKEKPQIEQMTQMTEGQDGSAGHDQELTRTANPSTAIFQWSSHWGMGLNYLSAHRKTDFARVTE